MSNFAWVCFDCRMTVRRHGSADNVRCSGCAQPCDCLGYKVPIPAKTKTKAWEAMRERFYRRRREYWLKAQESNVRSTHDIEREIVRLEAMPRSRGRSVRVTYLKKRLK